MALKDVNAALPRRGRAVCEISLENPRPDAIRTRAQLQEITSYLRGTIDQILQHTGRSSPIHLFAAAPAPVLVALGQLLPRRIAPAVFIHDYDPKHGFGPGLSIIER